MAKHHAKAVKTGTVKHKRTRHHVAVKHAPVTKRNHKFGARAAVQGGKRHAKRARK